MTRQSEHGWQYSFSLQKRRALRFLHRIAFHVGYFFSPEWAFHVFFLHAPHEMIPELLTQYGAHVGERTVIHAPLHIHNMGKEKNNHFANLEIGERCYLGPDLFIDLSDRVKIEDRATISMRAALITHIHVGESPLRETYFPPQSAPVTVRQGAYIGCGATVLKGVVIGKNSAVGAGSLVNKDVPPRVLAAGCPARIIRKLEKGGE